MFRCKGLMAFAAISLLVFSGCASTVKKGDLENQGLKNQVSVLQARLAEKEREIYELKEALSRVSVKESASMPAVPSVPDKPSIKQIQAALKNAGFDPGSVDGKMGAKTRSAIRDFQAANSLKADGKVGKRTWAVLGKYLSQGVK